LSHSERTSDETRLIQNALNSEAKSVNIRLRDGEYQHDLAKTIAAFELEARFPDVKDLIKKLYGETRAEDIQFVRKVQTILKKMEKSNIITILPKKQPWELQRYALTSFKFQDVEKNAVVFATEAEVKQALERIHSSPTPETTPTPKAKPKPTYFALKIVSLIAAMVLSYAAILWTITQPTINTAIFILVFTLAAACSILLGVLISRKRS